MKKFVALLLAPALVFVGFMSLMLITIGGSTGANNAKDDPCQPVGGGPVKVSDGGDHVATAMRFFMGLDLTAQQAAGIVGNFQVESGPGLDPHARNAWGFSGIAQWDQLVRWRLENQFAKHIGKPKWSLNAQLRYAAWELGLAHEWKGHRSPYANVTGALRDTHSANAAAKVIFDDYETPMDGSLPKRQRYARQDAAKYGDNAPPSADAGVTDVAVDSTSPDCDGGTNQGNVLALQKTVLKFAWHTHAPDGRLKRRPAYAKAVKHAVARDEFAGQSEATGGRPIGDDCAAFIALLMTESGWDPSYNHHNKLSKGAGYVPAQEQWLIKHWKTLGHATKLDVSDLQPGDIGVAHGGGMIHIWVYVGHIPGFHGTWAEASYKYGTSPGFAPEARQSEGVLYDNVPGVTYYRRKGVSPSGKWMNPLVTHHQVTSPYGWRSNPGQNGRILKHQGVDLAVPVGTTIHSACTGKVISRENVPAWGGYETGVNCGGGIYVYYMHQSKFLVKVGEHVKVGDPIGKTGGAKGAPGSGDSQGPHLHFQIQREPGANDQASLETTLDPVKFMAKHHANL